MGEGESKEMGSKLLLPPAPTRPFPVVYCPLSSHGVVIFATGAPSAFWRTQLPSCSRHVGHRQVLFEAEVMKMASTHRRNQAQRLAQVLSSTRRGKPQGNLGVATAHPRRTCSG